MKAKRKKEDRTKKKGKKGAARCKAHPCTFRPLTPDRPPRAENTGNIIVL